MSDKGQKAFLIFKIFISLAAVAYVVFRITKDSGTDISNESVLELFFSISFESLPLLLACLLLLPVNLGLEAIKWKILIRPWYPFLSFFNAFKAVLTGISFGILTPNRIGDYAGRVLYLPEGSRLEATLVTFPDRLSQMVATLFFGSLFLFYFLWDGMQFPFFLLGSTLLVGFILLLLFLNLLLLFFPIFWLIPVNWLLTHMPFFKTQFQLTRPFKIKATFLALLLSILRYLVFSFQYFLALRAFGFEGTNFEGLGMISLVFLFKSVIPFVGLAELGLREWLAIEVATLFGFSLLPVFKATIFIYVVNIILPAIFGLLFLQQVTLTKELK